MLYSLKKETGNERPKDKSTQKKTQLPANCIVLLGLRT